MTDDTKKPRNNEQHIYQPKFNMFQETQLNVGGLIRDMHSCSRNARLGNLDSMIDLIIILEQLNYYTFMMIPDKYQNSIDQLQKESTQLLLKIRQKRANRIRDTDIIKENQYSITQIYKWERVTMGALLISGLMMPIEKLNNIDPFDKLIPD